MTIDYLTIYDLKQKYIIIALVGTAALAGAVVSCDNGCEQTRENFLHVSFVSSSGRSMKKMDIMAVHGETGYIFPGISQFDDVELDLINPNDSITYLLLQGTYTDFGDSFEVTDTVEVKYDVEPYYLDMACGCTVHYLLKSVTSTHHLFSTVRVVDPVVLTESGINIVFEY